MFFYASKIVGFLMWPSNIVVLMLLGGLGLLIAGRALPWARRLLATGIAALVTFGFSPLGSWMVTPLEERFSRGPLPEHVAGIIMLGGFELPGISRARGQLSLNEGAERLTESILLALQRPAARVVFTGGDGSMLGPGVSAAGPIADYLRAVGIAHERMVLEEKSRTTFENAQLLVPMLNPKPGDKWLLVTSAYHMPRAVGTFRRQGFDVIAWPVDYRTRGAGDIWERLDSLSGGLERVDMAFKEWLGLVAYRVSGRTAELWPGPDGSAPRGRAGAPTSGTSGAPVPAPIR